MIEKKKQLFKLWESMLMDSNVLMSGNFFFKRLHGVARNMFNCSSKVKTSLTIKVKTNLVFSLILQNCINFLYRMYNFMICHYLRSGYTANISCTYVYYLNIWDYIVNTVNNINRNLIWLREREQGLFFTCHLMSSKTTWYITVTHTKNTIENKLHVFGRINIL